MLKTLSPAPPFFPGSISLPISLPPPLQWHKGARNGGCNQFITLCLLLLPPHMLPLLQCGVMAWIAGGKWVIVVMQLLKVSKHITRKTEKYSELAMLGGSTNVQCWNAHLKNGRQARVQKEKRVVDKNTSVDGLHFLCDLENQPEEMTWPCLWK